VAGDSFTTARVLTALLGTAAVALIALIALRLWGRRAALAAGLLAALYPPSVLADAPVSEALFVPLVLALVLLMVARPRPTGRAALAVAVGIGALVGLAALTRANGLALLLPALAWAWRTGLSGRRRLLLAGTAVAATTLVLSPWLVRNAREFDAFVLISTQDGSNLAGTYNSTAARPGPLRGTWVPPALLPEFQPLLRGNLDEEQINDRLRSEGLDYVGDHPGYPFAVAGLNGLRIFGLGPGHVHVERIAYDEMGIPRRAQPWVRYSVYAMALLAIAGIAATRRTRRPPLVVWLTPAVLLLNVLIGGWPRYRVPIDPFLVLFAAAAVAALADAARSRAASTASA
jgi:4-amino-4-deoxy-L-arabinose transferase-like glycosyltransferase